MDFFIRIKTLHGHLNVKNSPVGFKRLTYLTSDGQRNYPKHVEFYSRNKFQKLVRLVGFVIRIYRDSRSPECQKFTCRL